MKIVLLPGDYIAQAWLLRTGYGGHPLQSASPYFVSYVASPSVCTDPRAGFDGYILALLRLDKPPTIRF